MREALEPLRQMLGKQPFLGSDKPLYCDIIVFSLFMMMMALSALRLLETDDSVYAWRERMFDAYAGTREAVGYSV